MSQNPEDLFEPLNSQIEDVLEELHEIDAYRSIDHLDNADDFDYDLTTNNYFGFNLADQDDLIAIVEQDHSYELQARLEAFNEVFPPYGGASGSRLISGNYQYVRDLEIRFGKYMSKSCGQQIECLLFNSGYHANIGIIPALAKLNDNTLVIMDQLVHASMIDGVRLSGLNFRRFKHNDLESLERILAKAVTKYENIIIAIESIYSMDGDGIDELADLALLKAKYADQANIILYCDEAHAVGLFGDYCFGRAEDEKVLNQFDIVICPLGKAIHAFGCLVFTSPAMRKFLVNTCRSFIYSTALPPVVVEDIDLSFLTCATQQLREAANQLMVDSDIIREVMINAIQDTYRNKFDDIEELANEMVLGDYHIIGLILGANDAVLQAREYFAERRIKVSAIRYPTVPVGKERIRLALHARLTPEDIDKIAVVIEDFIKSPLFVQALQNYAESE